MARDMLKLSGIRDVEAEWVEDCGLRRFSVLKNVETDWVEEYGLRNGQVEWI